MSRVVTYKNSAGFSFCQIQFDSGERVLISFATKPIPEIKVVKLVCGGLIPWTTVWKFNSTLAGGQGAYVRELIRMFPPDKQSGPLHPLDIIRDTLLRCSSIAHAYQELMRRQA